MGLGFGRDYEAEVPCRKAGLTREVTGENRTISGSLRSSPQVPLSLPEICGAKTVR